MNDQEILKYVDHTLLKPYATWPEIHKLCEEAIEYRTASVCIPPCFVKRVKDAYPENLTICTVIGFPLGYQTTEVKLAEALQAMKDGAAELDMVINLGDAKSGQFEKITDEIRQMKQLAGSLIVKVIVETCFLSAEEKIALCKCVTEAGADYIKTSTGFGTAGAVLEDIVLFKAHIGPNVKIKASGGIKTKDDMKKFLEAGCSRLGTSSAIQS
ncbi:MAG: deoxyribose-phosphate aldolase [Hungatella sp.]